MIKKLLLLISLSTTLIYADGTGDSSESTYDIAWDNGYESGFAEGKDDCSNSTHTIDETFSDDKEYDIAWADGYKDGYKNGWNSCSGEYNPYDDAWDDGYEAGAEEAKDDACESGEQKIDESFSDETPYDEGWAEGYKFAYKKVYEQGCKTTFNKLTKEKLLEMIANDMKKRHSNFKDTKDVSIAYQENQDIISRIGTYTVSGEGHYRDSYSNVLISYYTYDGETLAFKSDILNYSYTGSDKFKKVEFIKDKYNNVLINSQIGFYLFDKDHTKDDGSKKTIYLGLSDDNAKSNLYFKPKSIDKKPYVHTTFLGDNGTVLAEEDLALDGAFSVEQDFTAGMSSSASKKALLELIDAETIRYSVEANAVNKGAIIEFDISNPYDIKVTKESHFYDR